MEHLFAIALKLILFLSSTVSVQAGYYTLQEIGDRLKISGESCKIDPALSERAYFVSLSDVSRRDVIGSLQTCGGVLVHEDLERGALAIDPDPEQQVRTQNLRREAVKSLVTNAHKEIAGLQRAIEQHLDNDESVYALAQGLASASEFEAQTKGTGGKADASLFDDLIARQISFDCAARAASFREQAYEMGMNSRTLRALDESLDGLDSRLLTQGYFGVTKPAVASDFGGASTGGKLFASAPSTLAISWKLQYTLLRPNLTARTELYGGVPSYLFLSNFGGPDDDFNLEALLRGRCTPISLLYEGLPGSVVFRPMLGRVGQARYLNAIRKATEAASDKLHGPFVKSLRLGAESTLSEALDYEVAKSPHNIVFELVPETEDEARQSFGADHTKNGELGQYRNYLPIAIGDVLTFENMADFTIPDARFPMASWVKHILRPSLQNPGVYCGVSLKNVEAFCKSVGRIPGLVPRMYHGAALGELSGTKGLVQAIRANLAEILRHTNPEADGKVSLPVTQLFGAGARIMQGVTADHPERFVAQSGFVSDYFATNSVWIFSITQSDGSRMIRVRVYTSGPEAKGTNDLLPGVRFRLTKTAS